MFCVQQNVRCINFYRKQVKQNTMCYNKLEKVTMHIYKKKTMTFYMYCNLSSLVNVNDLLLKNNI